MINHTNSNSEAVNCLLINYANQNYSKAQKLNTQTGLDKGKFNRCIEFSPEDIDSSFAFENKSILEEVRGNGYWLWKPYFIRKALSELNSGEFLFYCDSGVEFIHSIFPLMEFADANNRDLVCFELNSLKEYQWTKTLCANAMNCNTPEFMETDQRLASYSLWKKTEFTMDFVDEWLNFGTNRELITDYQNEAKFPNYPGFVQHRHDQSIFSLLTKKYNLPAYRDPSQFGNAVKNLYPNSDFPQLLLHTRRSNDNWSILSKITNKLKSILGRK